MDRGKRILVVDDDFDSRGTFAEVLRDEGYVVTVAESGRAALRALDVDVPDLVLTDMVMPELTGAELARILASDDRFASVPVVLMTATRRKAEHAARILYKPFDLEELLHVITEVCSGDRVSGVRNLVSLGLAS